MGAREATSPLRERVFSLCRQGKLTDALILLDQPSARPDYLTLACLIHACTRAKALPVAKLVHSHLAQFLKTCPSDTTITITIAHNLLIRMFDQCRAPVLARSVFDSMPSRNRVSWNLMIAAHANSADGLRAFQLLIDMHSHGVSPDNFTFISILSACAKSSSFKEGRLAHFCLVLDGLDHVGNIGNVLITFYGACACLDDALRSLEMMSKRSVVSWNAILAVYCQYGQGDVAFELHAHMRREGIEPNNVSFIILLTACGALAKLDEGKKLHALIQTSGIKLDIVLGTALVDMYNKCGDFEAALKVFTEMPAGNVVSWTTIISAHVKHGYMAEACILFCQMYKDGIKANHGTILTLLDTCASAGNLVDGKLLHACIVEDPEETDNAVVNALISMYNRCGSLEDAYAVFHKTCLQDTVSWNALMSANSQHGHSDRALDLFEKMLSRGVKPTENTFISVLSACSHTGLLTEGLFYYLFMYRDCGYVPLAQHFTCMIDLFGRAGQLKDAEQFINQMPLHPGVLEWMALVSAYRVHSYMRKARCVVKQALELDPLATGTYVTLSNILAINGRWDDDGG